MSAVYDRGPQVRKGKYKDSPILLEGLDLVEDEQITHQIQLDEELDVQDSLSKFFFRIFLLR